MKRLFIIWFLILVLGSASCQSAAQGLSFEVLLPGMDFIEISSPAQELPSLIVVAGTDEIKPPLSEYAFSDSMLAELRNIDYEKCFALLIRTSRNPPDPLVDKISRSEDTVTIQLAKIETVMGNYVVRGYSMPYQLIQVSREGDWGKKIEFNLLDESGYTVSTLEHLIP